MLQPSRCVEDLKIKDSGKNKYYSPTLKKKKRKKQSGDIPIFL
jgi:hypothetical protein